MSRYSFKFERRVARLNRLFAIRPSSAMVTVLSDRLTATFGPWSVDTATSNVIGASLTGPYRLWRVAGPARMSLADRGITFGTNTTEGLCLTFAEPVRGIDPFGWVHHPTLTVTVNDPRALAAALGIDGELEHTDLSRGTLRATVRSIVRSLGTPRTRQAPPSDTASNMPSVDLPDDAQTAESGVGPWFHRRYSIRILDPELSAAELMTAITRDPNIICDTTLAPFVKDRGEPGTMQVGDRYTVRTAGPWDGPVEVVEIGTGHLRLATLDGHMEAGIIDICAREEGAAVDFEIESWARSGDRAFHVLYDVVGIAKTVQTEMWTTACERAADVARGTAAGLVEVTDTRDQPSHVLTQ